MVKHLQPQIRIKNAWLLRENTSAHLNELWGHGEPLRTDEEYERITTSYRKAWLPFEGKILGGLHDIMGLKFNQNIIDVYIAPWFSAFSDPMVIGVTADPDVFVDILTHELIHRLLTDNTLVDPEIFLLPKWQKMYGKELGFNTVVHIPVHAVHKAIYIDVLKEPSRLQRDIDSCKRNKADDYVKAWEFVEEHDYKQLIKELKDSYQQIAEKSAN